MLRSLTGPLLAVVLFTVYWEAPVSLIYDSRYSLLLSHSILFEHTIDLTRYFPLPLNPDVYPGSEGPNGYPYQMLELPRDHLYYGFPPGGSVLATPFVAAARLVGIAPVRLRSPTVYDREGEEVLQRGLAAFLTALWGWLVFQTARLVVGVFPAAVVAVLAGLGTQAMSTASRGLWSDTWGLVLTQAALLLLLRGTASPLLLGTLLSWMFFVRPTASLAIVAVLLLAVTRLRPRAMLTTLAVGMAWLCSFLAYSYYHYHALLPPYYWAQRLTFDHFWVALAGNLVSPARGLIIYVPAVLVVAWVLVVLRRGIPDRQLVLVAAGVIVAHLVFTSALQHWWGGHSYGPRLMTGALPWLVLLAVQAVAATLTLARPRFRVALVVTGLVGVALNAPAAYQWQALAWNHMPINVDTHPERLWDWHDPQFLAAFHPR
jgi:hypothetical protein